MGIKGFPNYCNNNKCIIYDEIDMKYIFILCVMLILSFMFALSQSWEGKGVNCLMT